MADLGGIISSPHNEIATHAANTTEQIILTLTGRTVRSEINLNITSWTTPKIIRVRQANSNSGVTNIVLQKRWASDMTSDFDTGVTGIPLIIDSGYPFKYVSIQSEEAEPSQIAFQMYWIEVQQ